MPGRGTHISMGAVSGGFAAINRAAHLDSRARLIESVGGVVAGAWSATWPDILEPATTPNHRGFCHAATPNAVVWGGLYSQLDDAQNWLRDQALRHAYEAAVAGPGTLANALHTLVEILCRLLAGAIVGIPAGYVSHACLDALTPKCIAFI